MLLGVDILEYIVDIELKIWYHSYSIYLLWVFDI